MDSEKEVSVIIAAAGQGTRIGGPVPKQFMMIGGEPILIKTLKVFSSMPEVDHIFIVTNEEYTETAQIWYVNTGSAKWRG